MERLDQCHVAALVSPLHDRDTNPSGEPKKPHYHVLLMFESPADYESKVAPIFAEIGAVGRETVNSARGYARYLCHLDNPEKAQYSPSEVRCMGGANFYAVTNLPTDDIEMLGEVFSFIREQGIYSLAELMDLTQIHHPDWFYMIVMSRCYVIDKYIKSLAWEQETGMSVQRTGCPLRATKTPGKFYRGSEMKWLCFINGQKTEKQNSALVKI